MNSERLVHTVVRLGQQPTDAQIREIELAATQPIHPDSDAPELTPEQCEEMTMLARQHRIQSAKPIVSLRISSDTLEKAKAASSSYTVF